MKHILEKIKEYETIIIHGHTRPDGDAIGSQYGLMYLIKASFPFKKVYVTGETSDYVSFIGKPNLIDEELFSNALSICLDTAVSSRLSDNRYDKANYSIKIDHHLKDEEYADYEYIDDYASSCAEIIVEFFMKNKSELVMTKECAEALLVGMMTDTGNFKYDKVNSKTFLCASTLMQHGVDLNYINKYLYSERLELLKLKGYCLSNFKITEFGFAYIILDKKTINEYNVSDEEAASLVSLLSTIKDVPAWAIFLESNNEIRVRLRSKGPNINNLAKIYKGGGHEKASGAKLNSWDELDEFLKEANELVINYNKTK